MTDPRGLFVPERCIILERSEKHDAIAELTAALWRSEPELDYRFIFQAIWDREMQLTTRISADIAMPHAQIPGMTKTYVCAGVSPEGIEYDQQDSPAIRLLILVVGPPDGHLLTLSALARYFSSEDVLQQVISATTPEALYEALTLPMAATAPEINVEVDAADLAAKVRQGAGIVDPTDAQYSDLSASVDTGPDSQRIILESALRIAISLKDSVLVIHTRDPEAILDWYRMQFMSNNQDLRDVPDGYEGWTFPPGRDHDGERFPPLMLVDARAGIVDQPDDPGESSLVHMISLPASRSSGEPVGLALLMGLSRGWLHKGQTAVSVYANNRLSNRPEAGGTAAAGGAGPTSGGEGASVAHAGGEAPTAGSVGAGGTGSPAAEGTVADANPDTGYGARSEAKITSSPYVLNSIELSDLERDFGLFFSLSLKSEGRGIATEVFMRVLQLCTELAAEGREGKPVGTILVLGDTDAVTAACQQLVVNPFRGYEESERNVLDPSLIETLKEFSRIDGATIIRDDGVIVSSGTYIRVGKEVTNVPFGLGARHAAAAGISAITRAVSFAISESTRQVSVFFGGSRIMVL